MLTRRGYADRRGHRWRSVLLLEQIENGLQAVRRLTHTHRILTHFKGASEILRFSLVILLSAPLTWYISGVLVMVAIVMGVWGD